MSQERRTQPTGDSVEEHLATIADERRRDDARRALALMREETGAEPVLWGASMIGLGRQPYTTADTKEHDWFAVGLSARKAALTLYGLTHDGTNDDLLARLGPHTTGKGCLYLKRLDDVDAGVLRQLVRRAWRTNHVPD